MMRSKLHWGMTTKGVIEAVKWSRCSLTAREIYDVIERNWPRSGLDYYAVRKTCSALVSRGILENCGTRKAARYQLAGRDSEE